jgi:hypothetical protein
MAKLREEDKKPSDVTHVDNNGVSYSYLGGNRYAVWMDKAKRPYWREMPYNNIECASSIRSVLDVDKIAALEKEREELLKRNECTVGSFNFEAHNLEQQAKGCFESIQEIDSYSKNGSSFVLVRDVNNFGVKKQLQAEALKDQT